MRLALLFPTAMVVNTASPSTDYSLATTPLYFVRSGTIVNSSRLKFGGMDGYYWSLSAASKHYNNTVALSALDFRLRNDVVYPTAGPDYRWYSISLRCLVITMSTISLYFVRSGSINSNIGHLWYAGRDGFDWSSHAAVQTSTMSATAYYFGLVTFEIYPSRGPSHRWSGRPLRGL